MIRFSRASKRRSRFQFSIRATRPSIRNRSERKDDTDDFKLVAFDWRPVTSDFKVVTSAFKMVTSVFKVVTSVFKVVTSDFRSATSEVTRAKPASVVSLSPTRKSQISFDVGTSASSLTQCLSRVSFGSESAPRSQLFHDVIRDMMICPERRPKEPTGWPARWLEKHKSRG
jgi:hypothetical protein